MDHWTHHIPILASELKPAGCRSYAMKRTSGIQNENITRMSLQLPLIPIQGAFNASAMIERRGEDSIYR